MSIFPTTILLATDGSAQAQLAATTAADLAQRTDSELHVITVGAGVPISATTSPAHFEDVLRENRRLGMVTTFGCLAKNDYMISRLVSISYGPRGRRGGWTSLGQARDSRRYTLLRGGPTSLVARATCSP